MGYEKELTDRIIAKFWDYPTECDMMKIVQYDASDNPTDIEYWANGKLKFRHLLTYDGSGRLVMKRLVRH